MDIQRASGDYGLQSMQIGGRKIAGDLSRSWPRCQQDSRGKVLRMIALFTERPSTQLGLGLSVGRDIQPHSDHCPHPSNPLPVGNNFREAGKKNLGERYQQRRVTFDGKSVGIWGGFYREKVNAKCAYRTVICGSKKMPAVCYRTRRAWFVLRGLLCRDRFVFRASGADDLIGGAEDLLGALFRDRVGVNTIATA